MVATSHMWPLSAGDMVHMTGELESYFNFNLATRGQWLPYWTATAIKRKVSPFNLTFSSSNSGSLPRARVILGSRKSSVTEQSSCPHDAYSFHREREKKHKKSFHMCNSDICGKKK